MGKLVEGQSQLEEGSQAIQKGLQDLNSNVQKVCCGLRGNAVESSFYIEYSK